MMQAVILNEAHRTTRKRTGDATTQDTVAS